jgi:hypothetical protein
MAYEVKAPLVLARDREGQLHHRYHGAVINWLDEEQEKHFVETGLVEKVDASDGDDGPPAKAAPKADWVAFAVSTGADEDEAESLTKQELQDLYGA